ncbi:hypothetical protein N665_0018s0044 [Sinapis alba]|nr:hypothetical protein N665_0018s0044 [Sinapis alba]
MTSLRSKKRFKAEGRKGLEKTLYLGVQILAEVRIHVSFDRYSQVELSRVSTFHKSSTLCLLTRTIFLVFSESSSPLLSCSRQSYRRNCLLRSNRRDVWEELERSPIGVIAKLAGRKSVWSGRTVHYLLCRQLFSLHEFGEITGLNTYPVRTKSFELDQYKAFWEELNIPLGMRPNAKRVFDDEAMMSYPWGRTAYEVLVDFIKMLDPQGRSYTINSMNDVLLVWAYESVSCFGEQFGRVFENVDIPLLRWGGKRTRASFATLFSEEMREHGEVRVRKMVMKESVEEMFPQWSGEAEDPQLVNLITNIHADKFVRGFWEVERNEKKKKVKGGVSKFDHHEGRFETIESRLNANNSKRDMPNMDQHTIDDIVKAAVDERLKVLGSFNSPMIDKTPGKGLGAKKNLAEDFASGAATPATGVKKNLANDCASGAATPASGSATPGKADKEDALDFVYISPAKVDKDAKAAKAKDAKAQKDGKDEAGQALGRGCRGKPNDQDALPKKDVVAKKRRKAAELKKQESAVKKEAELKKQKVTQIKKEKVVGTGTPPRANVIRVKFKNTSEDHSSLVEVTDEIRARENELLPESDVEEEELIRSARIKEYRERSVQLSPKGCALMAVYSAPVFPYIGDNGTTCMRKNFQPSSTIYDHLAHVDLAKFEKLMQHINEISPKLPAAPTKKPSPRSADYEGEFYSILMKERPWPDTQYGWLFDNHVAAYMKVLIGRSMRDPTPFWSKRIAFIDPWFITLWVHDFKQFKINPNLMKFKGIGYEDLSKGMIPFDFQTNLKWFEDVDHLYGVLQVSSDHWVAFYVDLKKEKIDCYDPIIGQITEESETKMIVALSRSRKCFIKKQFAFRRRKSKYIPQNTQVGDCGVYSLKFIECLALGVTFDGLNDIQGLRVKMATEIHDEEGNSEMNNILS